jgi:hypothetical protein
LRTAGAVDDFSREDRTKICSISLPHYSPEHGIGFLDFRGPEERDLAHWLYGGMSTILRHCAGDPDRKRVIRGVLRAFIEVDAGARDWKAAAEAVVRSPHLHQRARAARREAHARRAMAMRCLDRFLHTGLALREGERLVEDERTWLHLAARRFSHPRLRVCEQCAIVFCAPRALRCGDCRRRPVRIRLRPVESGGWHVDYRVGGRWATEHFDRAVHYVTVCDGCATRFETTRSNVRFCRNCRCGSGRVRRHRGGSRTGRQRFRFRHAEGARDWSVGFTTLDGRSVNLEAVDGIIETVDAEIGERLTAMGADLVVA